jgi:hypothetical protein
MSLILEKVYSQTELQELGLEAFESMLNGSLTESRYDQIIEIVAANNPMPETLYAMIMDGKPAWREKHIKRFKIQTLL